MRSPFHMRVFPLVCAFAVLASGCAMPDDGVSVSSSSGLLLTSPTMSSIISIPSSSPQPVASSSSAVSSVVSSSPRARIIRITAEEFAFTPNLLSVQRGEKVTLLIEGKSGTHGFAIPALRINERVEPGQTVRIDLPTDEPGSYDIVCSMSPGDGHRDMRGKIVIQ